MFLKIQENRITWLTYSIAVIFHYNFSLCLDLVQLIFCSKDLIGESDELSILQISESKNNKRPKKRKTLNCQVNEVLAQSGKKLTSVLIAPFKKISKNYPNKPSL